MIILDPYAATLADLRRLAAEVDRLTDTSYSLREAFPLLAPAGAFVPANPPSGPYGRMTAALMRRGLAVPDPTGVWPVHLSALGLVLRDYMTKATLRTALADLEAYRQYARRCPTCNPEGHRVH